MILKRAVKAKARESKRDALYYSVHRVIAAYIANLGGKVVIFGPIQIQVWPGDKPFKFTVAIKCVGRKPDVTARAKALNGK